MEIKEALELLRKEHQETVESLKGLIDTQEQQIKQHGGTLTDTAKGIEEMQAKMERISADFVSIQGDVDELAKQEQRPGVGGDKKESPADIFLASDEYQEMKKRGGRDSGPVEVKQLVGDDSTAAQYYPVEPFRVPGIFGPPERPMHIRDLLNVRPTGTNLVQYVRETDFGTYDPYTEGITTNKVGAVRNVAEGALKPRAAINFELKEEAVRTIAHWIPASRQVLDDEAQLRAYLDTRMRYGIKAGEDWMLLYGDRDDQQTHGIMQEATVYDWATNGEATDSYIDCIRRMIGVARVAEYPVSGIVMHPNTWEAIELLKDTTGKYVWVNVNEGGQTRLWRVPVIDTTAIATNHVLVGAFGLGAMLWDRQQATIRISEHHDDYFVKNTVAILAEERVALTVFRPQAFVQVDLENAPSS